MIAIFFETLDAPIVRWDAPLPFPTPTKRQPALGNGTACLLHDNIWNTNYPFWYPWRAATRTCGSGSRFTCGRRDLWMRC